MEKVGLDGLFIYFYDTEHIFLFMDDRVIEKIKDLMLVQGYSRPKLAELSGLSNQTIFNNLTGRTPMTDKTAEKILSVFGLTLEDALIGEEKSLNTAVRGYLEYNGEIRRINSFRDVEKFVEKYQEEIKELPRRVKEDRKLDERNRKIAKKHQVKEWDIVLDRIDTYDCSQVDVWAFRKADDERDGIINSLGNMAPGYGFEMDGQHFYGSEQAYICGLFSHNDPKHIEIQQALVDDHGGFHSKKKIRQDNKAYGRDDWETFNIEWMKYVVWQKVQGNEDFRKLLLSVPRDAYIIENSTHQTGPTASIWGAKNKELEDARERAAKYLKLTSTERVTKKEEQNIGNALNYIGQFQGKNLMGKILKLCQLALLEGKELDIDYELLRSKNIYLLGKLLTFEGLPKKEQRNVKAVIFDFDGTLIDTTALDDITTKIRACKDEEEKKRLWKELYAKIPECKKYDGMDKVLKELEARGVKICIVSGSAKQKMDRIIKYFNLPIPKELRFGRYALGRWQPKLKPDPQPFLNAIEKMGVKPGEVIALGNQDIDIQGANRAGIKSAACTWGAEHITSLITSHPDYIFERPEDLLKKLF